MMQFDWLMLAFAAQLPAVMRTRMITLADLFPGQVAFPPAERDVAAVPVNATSLRLVAKAAHFGDLPTLADLQSLWAFELNERSLEVIGRISSIRRLYIDTVRSPSLKPLVPLIVLNILSLNACTKVDSLAEVAPFSFVNGLALIHFPRVRSLAPLANFRDLTALAVTGGAVAPMMVVESLAPLSELRNLQFLDIANLRTADESLQPLCELDGLEQLNIGYLFPFEQFARLSRRLPRTTCRWFAPFVPLRAPVCPTCDRTSMVILTGKRQPTLCQNCHTDRVARHIEAFARAAEAA